MIQRVKLFLKALSWTMTIAAPFCWRRPALDLLCDLRGMRAEEISRFLREFHLGCFYSGSKKQ